MACSGLFPYCIGPSIKWKPLAEHWRVVSRPKWQLEGAVDATRQSCVRNGSRVEENPSVRICQALIHLHNAGQNS